MNETAVEGILKYVFKDKSLLRRALTHPSFFTERRENYQKLEFLGDSILDFVVAEYLYQEYSDKTEGDLTKMRASVVSKDALSDLVKEMGLDKYAYVGRAQGVMSAKMSSDVYEAVVAAIYLDGGLESVRTFIKDTAIQKLSEEEGDYKSKILEYAAKNSYDINFDTTGEGPSHKMRFSSIVSIEGKEYGKGQGYSKVEAEQKASKQALINIAK